MLIARFELEGVVVSLMKKQDFWAGLMFVVLGAGFAWGATTYSFGTPARPGPAYLPFGLGGLLALIGAFITLKPLVREPAADGVIGPIAWRPLLAVALAIVVFAAALPSLGLAISLPLLVMIISFAGDEFHPVEVLLNSAILTVGSWLIFIKGLGLTLPMWPSL